MTDLPDFVIAGSGVDPLAGWGASSPVSESEEKADGASGGLDVLEVMPSLEVLAAREAALLAAVSIEEARSALVAISQEQRAALAGSVLCFAESFGYCESPRW